MATAELETKTDLQPAAPSSVSLAISFEETREQLTELVARSSELVVTDVNDKAGIAEVREHRLEFKRIRVSIENRRKSIKAPLLEAERKVDSMAKELTAIIEPEEKRLEHQEKIVEREKARLEQEAAERRKATLERRLAQLRDCITPDGNSYISRGYDPVALSGMTDEAFHELLRTEQEAKDKYDRDEAERKAEQDRIAEEQRLEREKLEREKAELARKNAEAEARTNRAQARSQLLVNLGHAHEMTFDQLADMDADQWENVLGSAKLAKQQRDDAAKAEQERLDAQKKEQELAQQRIDAELDRIYKARKSELMEISVPAQFGEPGVVVITRDTTEDEYQVVLAKAKEWKSQYDAHVAAEEKAAEEREAADAKAKAEAAEAELARLESLRPDHEKILAFITLFQSLEFPTLSPACKGITPRANDILNNTSEQLHELADELAPKSNAV